MAKKDEGYSTGLGMKHVKLTGPQIALLEWISSHDEKRPKAEIYVDAWCAIQDKRDAWSDDIWGAQFPWRIQPLTSDKVTRVGVSMPPVELETMTELCNEDQVPIGAVIYTMLYEYLYDYAAANPDVAGFLRKQFGDD